SSIGNISYSEYKVIDKNDSFDGNLHIFYTNEKHGLHSAYKCLVNETKNYYIKFGYSEQENVEITREYLNWKRLKKRSCSMICDDCHLLKFSNEKVAVLTSDCGLTLKELLKEKKINDEQVKEKIDFVQTALGKINFEHGDLEARNICLDLEKENQIKVIDLEKGFFYT
ncbi:hypothetical protein RFI_40385, partial [Reticulomyxa filosa]